MEKKFGPMMQMAFVVNDFDEPINFWTKKMNIGPFFKLEHLNVKDVYYMDKPTELDFSVAIVFCMALPNVLGLYFLAPVVKREVGTYLEKLRSVET